MFGPPADLPGAQDTIYLCNFRVSVDGDWLCLRQLEDVAYDEGSLIAPMSPPSPVEPFSLLAARDPMLIERSNLVNISKLVVKELIETSHKYGRMLDSDHLPLQHFFIVLEHVLRHGLKPKKGLLGPKKELWDILQIVEKYSTEAADTTASVRDLPTVTTAMGRARAWMRLALMQKKLADYLKVLVDRRDELLAEFFEHDALLMSDEAFIIIGLLVGLNVIDCNLCLKEEDLDFQQGMINFSLYLRSSHHYYQQGDTILDPGNMTTVLDQKNYIEELNRHLNATVSNLEAKVENLQTTNALMKEDLDIAKKNLQIVTEENSRLRRTDTVFADQGLGRAEDKKFKEQAAVDMQQLRDELEGEKKKRVDTEKELKLQVSMKSEMEVAMKLLEKDIHEKQATIGSLQKQLDEIKLINLEMFKKLQECEEDLTQKGELVSRLQKKTTQIGKILNNMEKYNVIKDLERGPVRSASIAHESGTRPTSWAQTPTNADIFDKKSPMYYKKVDPLNNIDFSKVLPAADDRRQKKHTLAPDCESSLKQKTELVTKLEVKIASVSESLLQLEDKASGAQQQRLMVDAQLRNLIKSLEEKTEACSSIEGELKVERDWRTSLEEVQKRDRETISTITAELNELRSANTNYLKLKEDYKVLETKNVSLEEICREHELTLEELGSQLSVSKLKVVDMQEEARLKADGQWASDKEAQFCKGCSKEFNITRRKHHCRNCGGIFCNACSDNTSMLASSAKPVRVCDTCHVYLVSRNSVL